MDGKRIKVPKPPTPPDKIVLELTEDEAIKLKAFVNSITREYIIAGRAVGGNHDSNVSDDIRIVIDIWHALEEAGIHTVIWTRPDHVY